VATTYRHIRVVIPNKLLFFKKIKNKKLQGRQEVVANISLAFSKKKKIEKKDSDN
jgi:hypothetical protein